MKRAVVQRITELLPQRERIRNISVIAHVDAGKSTLTDSLVARAGMLAERDAGNKRFMDTRDDEKDRTITIKSTAVSMVFDVPVRPKHGPNYNPNWPRPKPELKAEDGGDDHDAVGDASAASAASAGSSVSNKDMNTQPFLINLIDSPGHVDFSSEVTAALRVTDGALVIVDCIEGVCVQTRTVLRQALAERIKPVLFVNKLDRLLLEVQKTPEEIYRDLENAINGTNQVIQSLPDPDGLGDVTVWPQAGTVGFGSGLHGWGFTLETFAKMYHGKFNVSVKKMMKKLWGNNFWDPAAKKWTKKPRSDITGKRLKRGFCMLVLEPLQRLFKSVMEPPEGESSEQPLYKILLEKAGKRLPRDAVQKDLKGKNLLKRVMQTWLPAADAILYLVVRHLPSPVAAQQYRMERLYTGPKDDAVAQAITNCDPDGPLMMFVSKMVPNSNFSRFFAFGRVFSGTVRPGATVHIVTGSGDDKTRSCKLAGCVLLLGPYSENLEACGPGNMCALVGIDGHMVRAGTVTNSLEAAQHPIVPMKYSVAPVVRMAVKATHASQLKRLTVGLKRLIKSDPLVQVLPGPPGSGTHIIAGCGELHLEICLKDLQEMYMGGKPEANRLIVSDPVVAYRETVIRPLDAQDDVTACIGKSPNKLNRVFVTASASSGSEAQAEALRAAASAGRLGPLGLPAKEQARILSSECGWQPNDARRLWSFGVPTGASGEDDEDARTGPLSNAVIDATRGQEYMHMVKDHIVSAFNGVQSAGVLCGEPVRGVRFDVVDAKIHSDGPHRGSAQIVPAARAALSGALLAASPRLLEPVFRCEITVPSSASQGVFDTLRQRRGVVGAHACGGGGGGGGDDGAGEQVEEEEGIQHLPGGLVKIIASLPIAESFGFTGDVRGATGGEAFPQLSFSHWQMVPGDPLDESDSLARQTVLQIRKRKGMPVELPTFAKFHNSI